MRIGQGPKVISTRKTGFVAWLKTFFYYLGDHPNLDKKNDSIWVNTNQNLGQDRLMLFAASETAPHCKFLATRLALSLKYTKDFAKSAFCDVMKLRNAGLPMVRSHTE